MSSPSTWAARHLQAFLGALGRLSRQPLSTLLTLVVIALALALPAGLWLFVANARAAAGGVAEAVDVTVYLKADVPLAKAQQLASSARGSSLAPQFSAGQKGRRCHRRSRKSQLSVPRRACRRSGCSAMRRGRLAFAMQPSRARSIRNRREQETVKRHLRNQP